MRLTKSRLNLLRRLRLFGYQNLKYLKITDIEFGFILRIMVSKSGEFVHLYIIQMNAVMDITARKYKFIEEFMKIISTKEIEKLELLEEVLHADIPLQDDYTLTAEQREELDKREARHLSGETKSHSWSDIKQRLIRNHGLQTGNQG